MLVSQIDEAKYPLCLPRKIFLNIQILDMGIDFLCFRVADDMLLQLSYLRHPFFKILDLL